MTGQEMERRQAATVPWEAFDDTHPDHAEWVARTGYRFCGDDCAAHGPRPEVPDA